MDTSLDSSDLPPALHRALESGAEAAQVRVVPALGGYCLVAQGFEPVHDRRHQGPLRLGIWAEVGRKLGDLD